MFEKRVKEMDDVYAMLVAEKEKVESHKLKLSSILKSKSEDLKNFHL